MPALLFDLDGTLLDTDHLHHGAFAGILGERGRALTLEDYRLHVMGHPNEAIMARFFPGEEAEHDAIVARKETMVRDGLGAGLTPTRGIHALLDRAEALGFGTAVVTNAPRESAEAMLAATGLAPRLPLLVIGAECARPKPDPAPYLAAMARLGESPARCIAFEDSLSGLAAALASGAFAYGMAGALGADRLRAAGAHGVIEDFADPALAAHLDRLKDPLP